LRALPSDESIDLAFIDADKPNYGAYYHELLPRVRTNGVILVDNVLWSGRVIDSDADDDNTRAIRAFNDKVASDDRVESVMLPISDGLTLLRKR
jgi:caffeoyl-CoA O-methyltransferase